MNNLFDVEFLLDDGWCRSMRNVIVVAKDEKEALDIFNDLINDIFPGDDVWESISVQKLPESTKMVYFCDGKFITK